VSKEANRAAAPEVAKFIDAMREAFGEVVVLWVKEGDFERGTKVPEAK
jgi:hypothetical protein